MPFVIVRQDIVKMKVDAVVNAANTQLQMGGGVCGAIFEAAGCRELQNACDKIAPIKTGSAALTLGFKLSAKYIIHAAGPVYNADNTQQSEIYLRSAYTNSLHLALQYKCKSIAFPLISSGIYGYPKDKALQIASSAIRSFLNEHDLDIFLAVFDKSAFNISKYLLGEVNSYIDEYYVKRNGGKRRELLDIEREILDEMRLKFYSSGMADEEITKKKAKQDGGSVRKSIKQTALDKAAGVEDLIDNLDEPFSAVLLRLIAAKGKIEPDIYKRANINRKLFSKIRTIKNYMPSKRTALALAVALELNLDETNKLLRCAGFALSHSQKSDVIVEYFIVHSKYDIFEINEILFKYDQPLLGGV